MIIDVPFKDPRKWFSLYLSFSLRMYVCIYRMFRGVSPARPPPVTGRSASFRLRFRFVRAVRAVRAGEAKLRGRIQTVILIAGPPG